MPYSAMVRRLLISCPGDVPENDLRIIQRVVSRWNVQYGPVFTAAIVPVSWGEHAAAEFGRTPQDLINDQLVDYCDIGVAVFANRLGTPTANAESGTAEEIVRLHEAGKYVGVLRCRRHVDPRNVDAEQLGNLEDYLKSIWGRGLILDYASDSELAECINNILAAAVASDRARSEMQIEQENGGRPPSQADVWPRVESTERVESSSKGRVRTRRNWYLVLTNGGDAPARNVRFTIIAANSAEDPWMIHQEKENPDAPDVKTLAPKGGEARFTVMSAMGIAQEVDCVVSWDDDDGAKSNEASLRMV